MSYYQKESEKVAQESIVWRVWKIVGMKILRRLFWLTFDNAGSHRILESMDPTYGGTLKMRTLSTIIQRIITNDKGQRREKDKIVEAVNIAPYLVWNGKYLYKSEDIRKGVDGTLENIRVLATGVFDKWLEEISQLDPTLDEEVYVDTVTRIFQKTVGEDIINQFVIDSKQQTVETLPADEEPSLYALKIRNHLRYFSILHEKITNLSKGKIRQPGLSKEQVGTLAGMSEPWFVIFNAHFAFIYKALHYLTLSMWKSEEVKEVQELFIDLEDIDDTLLLSHLKRHQLVDETLSLEEVISSDEIGGDTSEETEDTSSDETNSEGETADETMDASETPSGEETGESTDETGETVSEGEGNGGDDETTAESDTTTREETRPTRPESGQVGEVVDNPDTEKEAIKAYLEPLMGDKLNQLTLYSAAEVNRPLYHISMDSNISYFTPQISKRTLSVEDRSLPRISTSTCLIGCLNGYQSALHDMDNRQHKQFNGIFTVYDLPYQYAVKPSKKLLADVDYSDEYWLVSYKKETYRTIPHRLAEFTIPKIERVYGKDTTDETYHMYVKVNQGELYLNQSMKLSQGYYSVLLKGYHFRYPLDQRNLIEVQPISERDYNLVTALSMTINTR